MFAMRPSSAPARRSDAGFGMIELLCAMGVMSIGILAVFALFQSGMVQIRRASTVTTAAALADSEMERFRALKFEVLGLDDSQVATADSTYTADSSYRSETAPLTTLDGSLTDAQTSVTLTATTGFPASAPFRVKVDSEIMYVTAVSGLTWTVIRAIDGTAPSTHASGATVSQRQRVHLTACGTGVCTSVVPTKSVNGADGNPYRVDTYVTWQLVTSADGTTGRNAKLITLVVRDQTTPSKIYARVASTFDEATGL